MPRKIIDPHEKFGVRLQTGNPCFLMVNNFVDVYCRDLEYLDIAVYLVLCRFAGKNACGWPSYSKLAELLGASKRAVMQSIKRLCTAKFVKRVPRKRKNTGQTSNYYVIQDLNLRDVKTCSGELDAPGVVTSTTLGVVTSTTPPIEDKEQLKKNKGKKPPALKSRTPGGCEFPPMFGGDNKPPSKIRLAINRFYMSLTTHRYTDPNNPPDLSEWTETIRKYCIKSEYDPMDVCALLNWYSDHVADDRMQEAYCAETFCTKYPRIKRARDRWQYDQEKKCVQNGHAVESSSTPDEIKSKTVRRELTEAEEELLKQG